MTSRPALVADPAAVTPSWLTEVLHHAGLARGQRVVTLDAARIGTGQVGENVRYRLTYDTPGDGPGSVVAKFAASDDLSRTTGVATRNYEREVWFYDQVQPTVGIRTPRYLFGAVVAGTAEMVVVLEDLAPAVQGDQLAGCSVEQARLAMSEAAALHGPRWGDPSLAVIEWLSRPDPETLKGRAELYRAVHPGFVARYRGRLDPDVIELSSFLGERLEAYSAGTGGPRTVTHGDFRLDNLLFGVDDHPYPVATVDWGGLGHGEGLADVAYFLGAGLLPEVREAHEAELVIGYHAALVEHGVVGHSAEACWEAYRWYAFSGLLMAVVASQIVRQEERGDEMFCVMAERHARQALHLNSPALLG
jgi:hypothetical protein